MLFRSVAKCSAYGTNAMHCTSKHRRCDTTTALVREIPETLFVPAHAEGDIFIPERRSQPVNDPMTFLDFFSGVGGFRKGFELCGMVCKGHCEIDKFADRSYRAIHDVKEDEWYGEDITKTEPADLPRVNLWAGGFPCQDISVSGRQRGLAGKRSSLFFEIVRLLKGTPAEDRPEWLVLENVKNLLSVNRGWNFATVLHSLAEIGYHIEYGLLNSRFHGVPQNRERIYLVAYRHFRAEGGRKVFPVTAGDGKALIQLIGGTQGKRVYDPAGVSCTLMSEGGGFAGRTGMYFIDLCKGEPRLTEHARCIKARYDSGITNHSGDKSGVLCMSGECPDRTEETALIQLKRGDPKILEQDHTKCLIAGYDKIGVSNRGESSGIFYGCRAVLTPDRENKRQNGRRFKACGEPAFCLNTQDKHGVYLCACDSCEFALPVKRAKEADQSKPENGSALPLGCGRIRKLTPRECWRLQGFSDDMFDRAAAVNSDAQLYKQAGNGVTIPVVYAVGKRIAEIQNELDKEAEAFQKKVKKSGLSREAYLRHLVNGLEPQDAPPPDYYAMMRELHGIGNNLNQIAAKAHTLNALDVQRYDENCRKLDEAIKTITAAVILPRPMK